MAPASNMPAAEVDIDAELVRRLVASQAPDLLGPVEPLAFGWDNAVFRLGDAFVVRMPRRALGAATLEREQRWLPVLGPGLPLPAPVPVHVGQPGLGYPWTWSVCPWLPGTIAATTPPADPVAAAEALGAFVTALATPAPADAPANPYRGVPLAERDAATRERIDRIDGSLLDGAVVHRAWDEALALPPYGGAPVWVHGDLHPANVLVDGGRLAAVIDFGDLTAGDPATDLIAGWMLFDAGEARAAFRRAAGVDDATWSRGRAWALCLAVAYLEASADHPVIAAVGRRALAAALAEW